MPPELAVLLAAMTPVGELRLSIPLGIAAYGLPWPRVLLLSLVGNLVPPVVLLGVLEPVARLLERMPGPAGRLFRWYLARVTGRYRRAVQRYGTLALVPVVAVPLPGTGAWTGALLAWALRLPPRRALPAIALGVVGAGLLVTLLTLSGTALGR